MLNQIDLSHASALDVAWAKRAPKRGPIKFSCWNNLEVLGPRLMYNLFRKIYDIYAVVNLPLPYITRL